MMLQTIPLSLTPYSFSLRLKQKSRNTRPSAWTDAKGRRRVVSVGADLKKLGGSDLSVSEICLGTMTFGQQNTEEQAHEQLNYAFENGINFLDTAEMYPVPLNADTQGKTDQYIGSWLKGRKREEVVVASKVCGRSEMITWVREGGVTPVVDRKNIMESVENSLTRLGTDHIDLLQIHWPDRYVSLFGGPGYDASKEYDYVSFEEQVRAMEELIQQGKIRHYGLSNETSFGVASFCHTAEKCGIPKPISIQNSYSLLVRKNFETDLAETCSPRHCDVSLLPYSPLAGGALSGKYLDENNIPKDSRFSLFPGYMGRFNQPAVKEVVSEYVKIAKKYELTPSQLALAFVKSRWFVASTIIGATKMEQVEEQERCEVKVSRWFV